ncbi:MAG: TonB-dependent receptor plug domain-containing protein, partial [Proteobacteria bacterium]|nr:TonB-dependent receptor plug domain-containing protein [Pseudomonadota bacterium]
MLVLLALSAALAEAPDVVVTGTRVEQDPHDVARSITVIEEQDPTDRDLPELLEQAPGVHMQLTNRGSGAPFLRGQVGPQNLVLVDGLAHNLSTYRTGPNQYLAVVDPFGDRIEIVRGPSSVLYGNGAMGGVIHVQSQPIGTGARLRATGTAASADASAGGRFLADLGNDTVGGRIGASST